MDDRKSLWKRITTAWPALATREGTVKALSIYYRLMAWAHRNGVL